MPASAAPAPGSAALLDHALACPSTCPVCGESVGRTPALCCAQCTCGRLRLACALPGGKTSRCPQCAQPATLRFKGSVTPAAAGPRESVVLTRARGAAAEEAEAASGGGASGAGGAGQVRREAVRVLARMVAGVARLCHEQDAPSIARPARRAPAARLAVLVAVVAVAHRGRRRRHRATPSTPRPAEASSTFRPYRLAVRQTTNRPKLVP